MNRQLILLKQEKLRQKFPAFPSVAKGEALPEEHVSHRNSQIWGPNAWLAYGDFALENVEEIKPFFTSLAKSEYENGTRNFFVEVIADQVEELQQWFELGFGLQHVSAILQDFAPISPSQEVLLRQPEEKDLPRMAELERELVIHQMASPVFSRLQPDSIEEIIDEWREDLDNRELVKYVAEVDGEVVGLAYGCSTEKSGLHSGLLRPENSATFAFCSVFPQYRGRGIGKSLASAVISELFEMGFQTIVTDWRATNQQSSNTWPKLGFIPTIYRLHRAV